MPSPEERARAEAIISKTPPLEGVELKPLTELLAEPETIAADTKKNSTLRNLVNGGVGEGSPIHALQATLEAKGYSNFKIAGSGTTITTLYSVDAEGHPVAIRLSEKPSKEKPANSFEPPVKERGLISSVEIKGRPISYEVTPFLNTQDVTYSDLHEVVSRMQDEGYIFKDAGVKPKNAGLQQIGKGPDGEVYMFDRGAFTHDETHAAQYAMEREAALLVFQGEAMALEERFHDSTGLTKDQAKLYIGEKGVDPRVLEHLEAGKPASDIPKAWESGYSPQTRPMVDYSKKPEAKKKPTNMSIDPEKEGSKPSAPPDLNDLDMEDTRRPSNPNRTMDGIVDLGDGRFVIDFETLSMDGMTKASVVTYMNDRGIDNLKPENFITPDEIKDLPLKDLVKIWQETRDINKERGPFNSTDESFAEFSRQNRILAETSDAIAAHPDFIAHQKELVGQLHEAVKQSAPDAKKWKAASFDERLKMVKDMVETQAKALGVEPPKVVLGTNTGGTEMGSYSHDTNTVTIHPELIADPVPLKAIHTTTHEMVHAKQHAMANSYDKSKPPSTPEDYIALLYEANLDDGGYHTSSEPTFKPKRADVDITHDKDRSRSDIYRGQPVEIEADTIADKAMGKGNATPPDVTRDMLRPSRSNNTPVKPSAPVKTPLPSATTPGFAGMSFVGLPMSLEALQHLDELSAGETAFFGVMTGGGIIGGLGETLNGLPGFLKEARSMPKDAANLLKSTPKPPVTPAGPRAATQLEVIGQSRLTRNMMRVGSFISPLVAVAGGMEIDNAITHASDRSALSTTHDVVHGTAVTFVGTNGAVGIVAPKVAARVGGRLVPPVAISLFAWDSANYITSKLNGGHTLSSAFDELAAAGKINEAMDRPNITGAYINSEFAPQPREYQNISKALLYVNERTQELDKHYHRPESQAVKRDEMLDPDALRYKLGTELQRMRTEEQRLDRGEDYFGNKIASMDTLRQAKRDLRERKRIVYAAFEELEHVGQGEGYQGYRQRYQDHAQQQEKITALVKDGALSEQDRSDLKTFEENARTLSRSTLSKEEKLDSASALNMMQQRRFGNQIGAMLTQKDGKTATEVMDENKRLVKELNLDPATANALFITTPEQLENLLKGYRKADGTMVNMQEELGIAAPSITNLVDRSRVDEGKVKRVDDPNNPGKQVVVAEAFDKALSPEERQAQIAWMKAQGLDGISFDTRRQHDYGMGSSFFIPSKSADKYLSAETKDAFQKPFDKMVGHTFELPFGKGQKMQVTVTDIKPVPGKENTYEMVFKPTANSVEGVVGKQFKPGEAIRMEWEISQQKMLNGAIISRSNITALHPTDKPASLPEGWKLDDYQAKRGMVGVQVGAEPRAVEGLISQALIAIHQDMPELNLTKEAGKAKDKEIDPKSDVSLLSDEFKNELAKLRASMQGSVQAAPNNTDSYPNNGLTGATKSNGTDTSRGLS